MEHNIGNQCKSDNLFTKQTRMLQSLYRLELGEAEGVGPFKSSHSYYGNMISNGEVSGHNFLTRDIFEYAKLRVSHKKKEETIDEFRLFNNLMSSMPMAFNLFFPLKQMLSSEPSVATLAIKSTFKGVPISEVTEIGLEYIPCPIERYTGDKTAMDAFIRFKDMQSRDCIIAIETKYSDSLGTNEASNVNKQKELLKMIDLFTDQFYSLLQTGSIKVTQIYRNLLLTERYRLEDNLYDSFSIVMAPKRHPSTQQEIESVSKYLKPEMQYKLKSVTLEDFVSVLIQYSPEYYKELFEKFYQRYLNFDKLTKE